MNVFKQTRSYDMIYIYKRIFFGGEWGMGVGTCRNFFFHKYFIKVKNYYYHRYCRELKLQPIQCRKRWWSQKGNCVPSGTN